jgi:hypothetical protein
LCAQQIGRLNFEMSGPLKQLIKRSCLVLLFGGLTTLVFRLAMLLPHGALWRREVCRQPHEKLNLAQFI